HRARFSRQTWSITACRRIRSCSLSSGGNGTTSAWGLGGDGRPGSRAVRSGVGTYLLGFVFLLPLHPLPATTSVSISVRSGPPSASKRDPLVLRFQRVDV